jgi:hypothetical protein
LGDRQVGDSGFITQLRRDTTGLLLERLGDTHLHELRAQGDAMDDDHAAVYALDTIARVRQLEAQRRSQSTVNTSRTPVRYAVIVERMTYPVEANCLSCSAVVTFESQPGYTTCEGAGRSST